MNTTRSLMRALNILDLFTADNPEIGVTGVSQRLGLNKATVSRLMRTLEAAGFLKKNEETEKYVLSNKFVKLSRICLAKIDLKTAAATYLKELSKKTNELIMIHIIKGEQRYCLDWIESTKPIRHVIEKEHVYASLHAGAAGKLLLAYLPHTQMKEIIKRTGLTKYTDKTITDPDQLKREIESIRKCGVAFSNGEHVPHAMTVSAPVRKWNGDVIAALSISWLEIDDPGDKRMVYSDLVQETALKLSQDLGYIAESKTL